MQQYPIINPAAKPHFKPRQQKPAATTTGYGSLNPFRLGFFMPCTRRYPPAGFYAPFLGSIALICSMQQAVSRLKFFAVLWLVIISVLFFLPGSALPQEGMFGIPQFDKLVHFCFFALLLFLWRFYFSPASKSGPWWLLLLSFVYGFGVELIQHYFIANRSFDTGDVLADGAGAVAGLLFWNRRYIKK